MAAKVDTCADSSSRKFRWKTDMIGNLIDCLINYKSIMAYRSLDFDADKQIQYQEVRLEMAKLYDVEDVSMFGPVAPHELPEEYDTLSNEEKAREKNRVKESKDMITKGKKRVMEKVKEIRQNFSKAVTTGTRSGSGKIVYEFYDKLITLWGGSAGTEPLSYGVEGDDFVESVEVQGNEDPDSDSYSLAELSPVSSVVSLLGVDDERSEIDQNAVSAPGKKRKASCVPKLIDNKRKHLEKQLSAAQRDQLLISESKEDAQFRKDLVIAMRESTASFTESIKSVSEAMISLGSGVCESIKMLSHAMQGSNVQNVVRPPMHQNMVYQNQFQHAPQSFGAIYSQPFPPSQQDPDSNENIYYYQS